MWTRPKNKQLVELQPRGGYREGQNRAPSSSLHQKPSPVPCSTAFCTTVSESGRADNETKIGRACVDHHHYTTSARNKQRGLLGALQVSEWHPDIRAFITQSFSVTSTLASQCQCNAFLLLSFDKPGPCCCIFSFLYPKLLPCPPKGTDSVVTVCTVLR